MAYIMSTGILKIMNNYRIFAKRLKKLRLNKQVNQQAIADYVGINQPAVARLESGKMEPTGEVLSKLADYFNVSTDYLLGRKEVKESTDLPDVLKRAGIDAIGYTGEPWYTIHTVINLSRPDTPPPLC